MIRMNVSPLKCCRTDNNRNHPIGSGESVAEALQSCICICHCGYYARDLRGLLLSVANPGRIPRPADESSTAPCSERAAGLQDSKHQKYNLQCQSRA